MMKKVDERIVSPDSSVDQIDSAIYSNMRFFEFLEKEENPLLESSLKCNYVFMRHTNYLKDVVVNLQRPYSETSFEVAKAFWKILKTLQSRC